MRAVSICGYVYVNSWDGKCWAPGFTRTGGKSGETHWFMRGWKRTQKEGRRKNRASISGKVNFLNLKKLCSTKLEPLWEFQAQGPMRGRGGAISESFKPRDPCGGGGGGADGTSQTHFPWTKKISGVMRWNWKSLARYQVQPLHWGGEKGEVNVTPPFQVARAVSVSCCLACWASGQGSCHGKRN